MGWSLLIVDDHAGFRASARALLEADGYIVLGEAGDGPSALVQSRLLHPQVVLLDVQLPGMDGFRVAERLAEERTPPTVVLISSRAPGTFRRRLESSSARGFIPKDELSGDRLGAVLA